MDTGSAKHLSWLPTSHNSKILSRCQIFWIAVVCSGCWVWQTQSALHIQPPDLWFWVMFPWKIYISGHPWQDFSILNQNLGSLGSKLNKTLIWIMDQSDLIMTRLWLNHLSSILTHPPGPSEVEHEPLKMTPKRRRFRLWKLTGVVTNKFLHPGDFVTLGFLTSTGMLNFRS